MPGPMALMVLGEVLHDLRGHLVLAVGQLQVVPRLEIRGALTSFDDLTNPDELKSFVSTCHPQGTCGKVSDILGSNNTLLQGFVNYLFRFSIGVAHRMPREEKGPKSPVRLHVGRGSVLLSKSNTPRLLSTQRIGGRQKCLKNWKGYCQKKVISVV